MSTLIGCFSYAFYVKKSACLGHNTLKTNKEREHVTAINTISAKKKRNVLQWVHTSSISVRYSIRKTTNLIFWSECVYIRDAWCIWFGDTSPQLWSAARPFRADHPDCATSGQMDDACFYFYVSFNRSSRMHCHLAHHGISSTTTYPSSLPVRASSAYRFWWNVCMAGGKTMTNKRTRAQFCSNTFDVYGIPNDGRLRRLEFI